MRAELLRLLCKSVHAVLKMKVMLTLGQYSVGAHFRFRVTLSSDVFLALFMFIIGEYVKPHL